MPEQNWHCLGFEAVMREFESSMDGLSSQQAKQKLQQFGPNRLPESRHRSLLSMLLGQFSDFMILVLLAAALVSGFIGEVQDTIAILVIVLLNAIIGMVQEYRAERAVAALREMAAPDAQVMRDGKLLTISATGLVPGDLVLLEAGNLVPADLRLVQSEQLQLDESGLTGESHAVDKVSQVLTEVDLALGDRINLAFKSSMVTRGRGHGIVVATGQATEIGQIAGLLQQEAGVKTPLQKRLARFGRYLAFVVLVICAIVFVAGVLQGQPMVLMFLTAVSLAVAAIPEALPAVVTISLAFGAGKLIRNNALVRNLPAVETLGSVTYICTDKTGTLTLNRMSAERFMIVGEMREALPQTDAAPSWTELGRAMALNNDIEQKDEQAGGEPTELALYEAAQAAGYIKADLETLLPRQSAVPFDSSRKMMTTLHAVDEGIVAYIKGAPERVIPLCDNALVENNIGNFDQQAMLAEAERLANDGYRVLAFGRRLLPALPEKIQTGNIEYAITFLGLVALIDPPRPEVPQAVADCLSAGIIPVMITGDHPGTAYAIASRLGITDQLETVLTGSELETVSDDELAAKVASIRVYARVSPQQKLRIVKALQLNGEFVAMTGDGVNDAPALKRAGIGVAMGQKGTDVAREAADMVLLDDNFATIVSAIKAGRRIFDNIRKFIKYTMSSNSGEIWTLFLAPLLGLPIPLLPIHILWINLVTDGLPGLAFASEPAEPGIMNRPPRPPDESIFAHGMWQHMLWVGLFVGGISIASQAWAISRDMVYWQTVVFTVLTLSQLFHSLAVRSEKASLFKTGLLGNLPMLGAIVFTLILQMAVIYLPVLNEIFHTQPLPIYDLALCLLLASSVLFAVEIEKCLVRKGLIYKTS
ncbi:MAG: cation-translocating P-type ATPase [Gammaproteobacteria bacterium]